MAEEGGIAAPLDTPELSPEEKKKMEDSPMTQRSMKLMALAKAPSTPKMEPKAFTPQKFEPAVKKSEKEVPPAGSETPDSATPQTASTQLPQAAPVLDGANSNKDTANKAAAADGQADAASVGTTGTTAPVNSDKKPANCCIIL
eukprot:g484.t1